MLVGVCRFRGSHCLCVDMDIDGMEVCNYVLLVQSVCVCVCVPFSTPGVSCMNLYSVMV